MKAVATSGVVSYQWQRAQVLRDFHTGLLSREEICDADFLLRAATQYHGQPMERPCPICHMQLWQTWWIYGEHLGSRSGSARSPEEIARIARTLKGKEFSVHWVEVCPHCHWNHLLETATVTGPC